MKAPITEMDKLAEEFQKGWRAGQKDALNSMRLTDSEREIIGDMGHSRNAEFLREDVFFLLAILDRLTARKDGEEK